MSIRRRTLFITGCVAGLTCNLISLGGEVAPVSRAATSFWVDDLRNVHAPGGDLLRSWTQLSGAPWVGSFDNWNPTTVPQPGDDLLFGTLKAGNYSVVQNMGITFNSVTVNRTLATEQMDMSGLFSAGSLRVIKGVANLTTTTFTVTNPGTTNALSSIVVGDGAASAGTLTFAGVPGQYYDARVGVNGGTGTLRLTGANTSLVPLQRNFTPSVVGGAADAANATILVDAATLEAWVITTGIRGTTRFTNGAQVNSFPTPTGVGQVQIGSPDASYVNFEVSASADLRVSGQDGTVLIGSGVGATTTTNILTGGSVVSDFFITGAQSTLGTGASNNTINISGTGSTVTTTEAFDTNGGYRYADLRRGSTNLNITSGGRLYTPRYDSNASDRLLDTGAASSTTLTVSGLGSLLQARTDVGGLFVSNLGDRTTDNITVSNFGKIDAGQITLGVGVGSTSTVNLSGSARMVAGGLFEVARPFLAGPATTVNVDVASGSRIICANFVTSSSLTSVANITLRGGGSGIDSTGVAMLGGVAGDLTGGGSTTLNINSGANANFVALQSGGASAVGRPGSYTGTQITLTGMGSQLVLRGSGTSTPQATDLAANLVLSAAPSTTTSFTVSNGANLSILDNSPNPNLDGSIAMSVADNTSTTFLVDGPDATVDAGKLITMAEAPTANLFANATATLTVRNGGFLGVYENAADPASGNLQMAIRPSLNSTANLNIGGGTRAEDADSVVAIDGTLFVGGSGDAVPVPGGRSTVNLLNGTLSTAATAIYANSRVVMNGGHLTSDNLLVFGGRVDMNTATPLTIETGAIRATSGGVINLGKGGGVVYYSGAAGSPTDMAAVRQLIANAYNGGAWNGSNGITSSLLSSATPRYAIGYADVQDALITNMIDLSFPTGTQGVAFRYTLRGDVNLDGTVGFADLLVVAQHYEDPVGSEWYSGDFDYNRLVNFDDLLLLAQNYATTLLDNGQVVTDLQMASRFADDWALARSLVPEPTSALLLASGFALVSRRRR